MSNDRFIAVKHTTYGWTVYDTARDEFILQGVRVTDDEAACRAAAKMMSYEGFTVPIADYDYSLENNE